MPTAEARHGIADLDDAVGLIYEAALDPALWPEVLRSITSHAGATCTVALVLEPGTARPVHLLFDVWPGYAQYAAYYASIDPRNAYGLAQPAGSTVRDCDFTSELELARSELYQDFVVRRGWGCAVMMRSIILSRPGAGMPSRPAPSC